MKINTIEHQSDLDDCLAALAEASELAIDLEFDKNRFRYGFKLCLMQIATPEACFIFDPLSDDLDIGPVLSALEGNGSEKIVFAFGEDLRLLHSLGCFPKGLFDLKTATSLLNYPPASLTNLLDEILDIQVGKSAQNSNWFIRPLTEDQIAYAADDVRYLGDLRTAVVEEAKEKGIYDWIVEENEFLDSQSYAGVADSNQMIRTKDKMGLSEFTWGVLEQLLYFRESLAKEINRPSYQIIHKDYLIELAKDPRQLNRWSTVRGVHRKVQTDTVKKQLQRELDKARESAGQKGLSNELLAVPRPTREESQMRREEKAKIDKVKRTVFDPIKKRLIAEYGENAATFMMSNRNVSDLITGDQSSLRPYIRQVLKRYADEAGVDVTPYV